MSVVVSKRSKSKLEVLNKTREVAKYTLHVCKNEKVFPKSWRWLTAADLCKYAIDMYIYVKEANSIYVKTMKDYEDRSKLQRKAYNAAIKLSGLIDLSYDAIDSVSGRRVNYWTGIVIDAKESIRLWTKNDRERYLDTKGNFCISPSES